MTRVRVEGFTVSLDGYGAGPGQDLDNPLGVGGTELHRWLLPTRTFQRAHGAGDGATGIDDDFAARGFANVGAWILGRNMFGPIRGPWPDLAWQGWWGDDPPYHVPVFVLTHHPRPPLTMEGGTTFHFITGGIHEALDRARDAADGRDVRIGGGPNTIQQYLRAGLIDELHIAISPVLLGRGERLFEGVDLRTLGYGCVQWVPSELATHVVLRLGSRDGRDPWQSRPDARNAGAGFTRRDAMVVVRIEHAVPNYDAWKRAFDSDPADRKGAGVRRYEILRQQDDPNYVMIDLEFDSVEEATAFLEQMERLWGGAGKAVMRSPRARIATRVEARDL